MGRIAAAFSFGGARRSIENPGTPFVTAVEELIAGAGGANDAGTPVSQGTSVRLSTVYRCVRVLSDDLASLPLFVLQREKDGGRRRATDHPLYELLHLEPNPRHSSYELRRVMQANVALQGNGYATIRRDRGGRIREIWPVPAVRVTPGVNRETLQLEYQIRTAEQDRPEPWAANEILHIPGLNFDGIKGMSVLSAAREAIGGGLAVQKFGNKLFARGGRVPGIITTPFPTVDPEKRKNVRAGWDESVGGSENYHVPAIFPKGWDYKEIGIHPDDAQWIETKKFNVLDVCRFFGVNPHKVFDYERATFTNFEQSSLSHITDTIRPWVVLWEQELNRKLLKPEERAEGYFIECSLQALMRGDTATRGAFYALGRQWGFFTINDILEFENMPGAGPAGDIRLVPFNMTNAESLLLEDGGAPPAGGEGGAAGRARALLEAAARRQTRLVAEHRKNILKLRRKIRAAQQPIIEDRAAMIVKREIGAIEKELKPLQGGDGRARRSLAALRKAIEKFYEDHGAWAAAKMQPILMSYAGLIDGAIAQELGTDPSEEMPAQLERWTREYSTRFGIREASEGRLQLLALIDEFESKGDDAAAEAVQQRLDEWGEKRAGKIGLNEAVQFMGGASRKLYTMGGKTRFVWAASPGACAFCRSLDGQTAGVQQNFVDAGDGVSGGADAGPPLRPSDNIGHPPLHGGCECDIVAE